MPLRSGLLLRVMKHPGLVFLSEVTMGEPQFCIGSPWWPGVVKVSEEAAEVIQVLAKLQATGGLPEHWDGSNLHERLESELGDLLAAIEFMIEHSPLSTEHINTRCLEKRETFRRWHKACLEKPHE